MRIHWKQAGHHIAAQVLSVLHGDGPYSAVMRAFNLGYDYPDPSCPLHAEFDRYSAAGDAAMANLIKNSDASAWHQECLALDVVKARREWAKNTSIEDDQARARADVDQKRAEERERVAIARANEMRAAEEAKAHSLRLEMARAEFDRTHPPTNGATPKQKEARS